ncbi:MAG: site-specific DNA-methyltransferase [Ignavibacteria bacterium]|nr:site-specific DNA-methyltransferase [Ignavibacteria bacterium]
MKQLFFGDCLERLKELYNKNPDGFIDLVYIDPPFNSKRNYNILFENIEMNDTKAQKEAFADTWSNISYVDALNDLYDLNKDTYTFIKTLDSINISKSIVSYLTTMAIRIYYIRKVLKKTGSFYLHCDPNMSHYLKIVCDLIFGKENFRNEIVWCYKRWTSKQDNFQNMHDIILRYSSSSKVIWNQLYDDFTEQTKKRIKGGKKINTFIDEFGKKKIRATDELSPGVPMCDYWNIHVIAGQAKERLGYPTQKPEALLDRIIKASSNEGDIVADFFCGCGTTIAVANRLNRQWIGVDISHLAIRLIKKRLTDPYEGEMKNKIINQIEIHGFPKDIASAKELAQKVLKGRFEFQEWVIEVLLNGIHNPKKIGDGGWDGYITFMKSEKDKGIILIEVKSGGVTVKNMREFKDVINSENADIGIFVCFQDDVTKPMELAAKDAGKYMGYKFDRIQIITIEDLLSGKEIRIPGGVDNNTFKTATKDVRPENTNNQLDMEYSQEDKSSS